MLHNFLIGMSIGCFIAAVWLLGYNWRDRSAQAEWDMLYEQYLNYHDRARFDKGAAYERGWREALAEEEREEREFEMEEQWDEVEAALEAWKEDGSMTLSIYPIANRPWGRGQA